MTDSPDFAALVCTAPHHLAGRGADEADIAAAEAAVGLLPPDYRLFLAQLGWAMFNGTAVWGLGEDFPYVKTFVEMTVLERTDYQLPVDLVAFSNNGAGDLSCFRLDRMGAMGAEVFVHLHETGATELQAPSFARWMSARADTRFSTAE